MTTVTVSEKRKLLKAVLTGRFSLGELESLAFDLGVDHESLNKSSTDTLARSLITYLDRRGQLDELIHQIIESRPDVRPDLATLISSPVHEFINRIQETEFIKTNRLNKLILIDSHTGLGKTALLKQIEQELSRPDDRKRLCLHLVFDEASLKGNKGILEWIATEMSFRSNQGKPILTSENAERDLARWLAGRKDEVYFLVDVQGHVDGATIHDLAQNLKKLHSELEKEWKPAKSKLSRVIIAGQYVRQCQYYRSYYLPAFDTDPIIELLKREKRKEEGGNTNKIEPRPELEVQANWIYQLSGGHPGCVINIIQHIREQSFRGDWGQEEQKAIFNSRAANLIGQIIENSKHTDWLRAVSTFRFVHQETLREINEQFEVFGVRRIEMATEKIDVLGELKQLGFVRQWNSVLTRNQKGLIQPSGLGFPVDDICKLLLADVRVNQPDAFRKMNAQAYNVYKNWVFEPRFAPPNSSITLDIHNIQTIRLWIIEAIHHYLESSDSVEINGLKGTCRMFMSRLREYCKNDEDYKADASEVINDIRADADINLAIWRNHIDEDELLSVFE